MNFKNKSTMFAMVGVLSLSMCSMTVSAETATDVVSSATTTTTPDSSTSDSSSTVALLDRNNLANGTYDFSVKLWNASKDQESMAGAVIKSAKLVVRNGSYIVRLTTQEMTAMGISATLDQLSIKQKDETFVDATKVEDVFVFTLPSLDDYIDVKVSYMGRTQEARLKLGWMEESTSETVDKSTLENLIASVETLNQASYTEDSYAVFMTVLTSAKEVNADKNASADAVNAAVEKLHAAKEALVEVVSDVLADGEYQLPVALWHATSDQASMANSALKSSAKLVVKNGEYQLYISTQPMTFGTITASLQTLKYPDAQGNYQLATVVEKDADNNPTQFVFPVYSKDEYIFVKVNPEVALMGNQDIDARIKLDWANVTAYQEESNESASSTVVDTTNKEVSNTSTSEEKPSTTTSSTIIKNTGAEEYSLLGCASLFGFVGVCLLKNRKKENM